MIKVRNLTKYYVKNKALDNVSFSLEEGEILGFLGPNGAGKSTTMNIITGYLSCDSGTVEIDGIDILDNPTAAKKKIGYLPEIPPLYNDMTVRGYLEFMFRLKKVKKPMKEHINSICELVRITDVKERLIKNLSKGYRQRIGFAQALIGDPPVLILDEPTVGLDPQQIIEIRRLIRDLGKKHTIILSSHLLSEVQAVCDKILIINDGKIVADELKTSLTGTGSATSKLHVIVEGRRQQVRSILQKVDGVTDVTDLGEPEKGCCEFTVNSRRDVRRLVFRAFSKTDFNILEMNPVEFSLEDTYLGIITGKINTKEAAADVSNI